MALVISPSVVENQQEQPPLTHARIGYQSVVQSADTQVTTTTQAAGFEADALKEYTTYDRWRASDNSDSTITITTPAAVSADYIGIAAHNLGSVGATLSVESSTDGANWSLVEAVQASDNSALMILFAEVTARYWRIRLTGMTGTPTIAVIYLGLALAMQRAIYQGHSPINLSRQTEIHPSVSEGGQWLGRSVVRRSLQTSYSWNNLKAAWYRANFDPFVKAARYRPFFIAWRPQSYQEVAYGWTNDDIQPSNSGPRDYMSVNLNVTAHAEE